MFWVLEARISSFYSAELFEQKSRKIRDQEFATFPKYVKRQYIARFLAQYEIFKRQLNIKGSVIECGVRTGGGLMTWAKISSTLEPYNYHREVIGFDTFEGFPSVSKKDKSEELFGPSENVFVHEFSKLRYGVFEEYGYPGDDQYPLFYYEEHYVDGGTEYELMPNFCTDVPLKGRRE